MKKKTTIIIALATVPAIAGLWLSGATGRPSGKTAGQTTSTCSCNNSLNKITFGPTVPGDAAHTSSQADFNCFAWAEFIALNWPMDAGAGFGDPFDTNMVQWETYITKEALFPPNGAAPGPWNPNNQNTATDKSRLVRNHNLQNKKILRFSTKFEGSAILNPITGSQQAFPGDGFGWLGAQDSTNVWYEVRLNKDIYDYVVQHKYYNAINQASDALNGNPINFPTGVLGAQTGAIELKAAWMEVHNVGDPKWTHYKLSNAVVQDLNTGQLRPVVVALVGLHILHKTSSQPTWVWTTFEQEDNVPSPKDLPGKTYNFFNPNCRDNPNDTPTYQLVLGGRPPRPIQITRVTPIAAAATNQFIQKQIKAQYPNSVWQHYQLVNVIWQNNPRGVSDTTSRLPYPFTSPAGTLTANTTMESYIQTNTCTDCHTYSTIANVPNNQTSYFGDFSFAIGDASYPKSHLVKRLIKAPLK